jgi:Tfp pilus assembly protein PilX
MKRQRPACPRKRLIDAPSRGAFLVLALVCLVVVMLIGASLLRVIVAEQRQLQQAQYALQAFWLADSAVARATARLAASPDYTGETWQVAADELQGRWPGVAVIRVEPTGGATPQAKIIVEGQYPQDPLHRVVQHREHRVSLPAKGEKS